MQVSATQLPNILIWAVSVPDFHCAVATITGTQHNGYSVKATNPGRRRYPEQTANIDLDRFPSLEGAIEFIQYAFNEK